MRVFALSFVFCLVLQAKPGTAQEAIPSVAVVPYLALNCTPEEEKALREVLSIEIASKTKARVLSTTEVQSKLPDIPDACPQNTTCVAELSTSIQADYLLFLAIVKHDKTIELGLLLAEAKGVEALRETRILLSIDPSSWSSPIASELESFLGNISRLSLFSFRTPTDPFTNSVAPQDPPTSLALDTQRTSETSSTPLVSTSPKSKKRWPWLLLGGGLLGGVSLGAIFFIYHPSSTLGSFGPGKGVFR